MPHLLQNKNVEVLIDLPGEGYQLPRFDWTGKIVDVKYRGIGLAGYEKDDAQPGEFIGRGFYNEFGIEKAIGFDDCREGEWFHKIGIGMLRKEGEAYAFHHPYQTSPLDFRILKGKDYLTIDCEAELVNGYAYHLKKSIRLTGSGLEIHYHLKNTGNKTIETAEYNHNFMMIGDDKVGEDYTLEFHFGLQPGERGEVVNPDEVVTVLPRKVKLKNQPKSPFFFSYLNGRDAVPAQWELINRKLGIGIRETGDFVTTKVNLWGWQGAISPELFFDVRISPDESRSWSRKYSIFEC